LVSVLLAPVTIGSAALVAHAAGLPILGVFVVALVVGIAGAAAAHRTVSSLLAGTMLLLARPFERGDRLRLYVPDLGETTDVEVIRVGLLTSTVCTGSGVMVVANADLLRPAPRETIKRA
jgi:small-conductance mechanosensitive channel